MLHPELREGELKGVACALGERWNVQPDDDACVMWYCQLILSFVVTTSDERKVELCYVRWLDTCEKRLQKMKKS